ncbi:MAG: SDR family oxidoreductase [Deltaproteobacteria bacterium]|nr:SDR family oxidoreductase [Deltaproteobacteria bacterium]
MARFTDKVIVVTGASEGIGRALCIALAPQKPRLVLAARNEGRLHELRKEVEGRGARALIVPTDVTSEEACKKLVTRAIEEWGCLDVLVNNAGASMWTRFEDVTDTSIFEKIMRLNYLGSVYCTYYALPYLKKTSGLIVAVSSVAGITGVPTRSGYAASKHALFGFFDSLRIELEGTGVDVTIIAPDFVLSEIHRRSLGHDGKPLGKSPMQEGKIMTAEKCASLIVRAMENRERMLLTSTRAKLGRWVRMFSPRLIDLVAKKAVREGK